MTKAIYFDMDGTIANLYGVENWLEQLINEDSAPYTNAKPMCNFSLLARRLNILQRKGYHLGIISWLSKNGSKHYNEKVTNAKIKWLNTHLKSVKWNEIKIISYGTPKEKNVLYPKGILFDDEIQNRKNWIGKAYNEKNILDKLKEIC